MIGQRSPAGARRCIGVFDVFAKGPFDFDELLEAVLAHPAVSLLAVFCAQCFDVDAFDICRKGWARGGSFGVGHDLCILSMRKDGR